MILPRQQEAKLAKLAKLLKVSAVAVADIRYKEKKTMSQEIQIKTEQVEGTAAQIHACNTRISDALLLVRDVKNMLADAWSGSAGERAVERVYGLIDSYEVTRYKVMEQYKVFLTQQVGLGYEVTEEENISLADAFK